MPPRTIVVNPTAPGPSLSFVMPAGVELSVESMFAAIDASGAGDVTAMLEVADSSGQVIARKRQGEVVSAGSNPGSATWALRLDDSAKAGAVSTPAWALVARDTNQAIASGFAQTIAWTSFATSDPSVFSTAPNGASGDTLLEVSKPGMCLAVSSAVWNAFFTADNYAIIAGDAPLQGGPSYNVPWFGLLRNAESPANSALKSAAPVGGTYGLIDEHLAVFPDDGSLLQGGFRVDAFQQSGVNRNILARMAVFFWPLNAAYSVVY